MRSLIEALEDLPEARLACRSCDCDGRSVASMIMAWSTSASLQRSRVAYYDQGRFADVFVQLKNAGADQAAARAIPGVDLQTRVVRDVNLSIPG